jgi:aspartokinase-like uncharacterized kinase
MTGARTVVKVGGSLFDMPDLGTRLEAWLRALSLPVLLVTGGGAVADFVRKMDRLHGLGEEKSHWLALRSLGFMSRTLMELAPASLPLFLIDGEQPEFPPESRAGFPLLDLHTFARQDETRRGRLPHCWEVSSDSLAARVAQHFGASELILLKSVTIPPEMDWPEARRRGFVDAYFPTMVGRGIRARAVNLREWRP